MDRERLESPTTTELVQAQPAPEPRSRPKPKSSRSIQQGDRSELERLSLKFGAGEVVVPVRLEGDETDDKTKVPSKPKETKATSERVKTSTETKVDGQVFVKGNGDANEVDGNDVVQGELGDCYFLATLGAIARKRPDLIKNMIKDNGDGTYTVTFKTPQGISGAVLGWRWDEQVVIDGRFWTDKQQRPVFAGAGDRDANNKPELWVMLIEKAYAKLNGATYDNVSGGTDKLASWDTLTGQSPTHLSTASYTGEALAKLIDDHFITKNKPVVFHSNAPKVADPNDKTDTRSDEEKQEATTLEKAMIADGVVGNHEYFLTAAGGGKYTMSNPWGRKHITDVDIEFIKKHFQTVRLIEV